MSFQPLWLDDIPVALIPGDISAKLLEEDGGGKDVVDQKNAEEMKIPISIPPERRYSDRNRILSFPLLWFIVSADDGARYCNNGACSRAAINKHTVLYSVCFTPRISVVCIPLLHRVLVT